jgi:hypothetical protein
VLIEKFRSEGTPVRLANEGAAFFERLFALAAALQPGVARILVAAKSAFDDVADLRPALTTPSCPSCSVWNRSTLLGDSPRSKSPISAFAVEDDEIEAFGGAAPSWRSMVVTDLDGKCRG